MSTGIDHLEHVTHQLRRVHNTPTKMAALVCWSAVWVRSENVDGSLTRTDRRPASVGRWLNSLDVSRGAAATQIVDMVREIVLSRSSVECRRHHKC